MYLSVPFSFANNVPKLLPCLPFLEKAIWHIKSLPSSVLERNSLPSSDLSGNILTYDSENCTNHNYIECPYGNKDGTCAAIDESVCTENN